jgi:hypothetical protein
LPASRQPLAGGLYLVSWPAELMHQRPSVTWRRASWQCASRLPWRESPLRHPRLLCHRRPNLALCVSRLFLCFVACPASFCNSAAASCMARLIVSPEAHHRYQQKKKEKNFRTDLQHQRHRPCRSRDLLHFRRHQRCCPCLVLILLADQGRSRLGGASWCR